MRYADDPDDGARPGDGAGRGDRLSGANALKRGVGSDPVGEVKHRLSRGISSLRDDVSGAERERELLALGMTAEGNDPFGAESSAGKDRAQADRAIADDSDGIAGLDAGADRGVMPGGHDVGQGEQRPQRGIGMT